MRGTILLRRCTSWAAAMPRSPPRSAQCRSAGRAKLPIGKRSTESCAAHDQPPRQRDLPLPAAARAESGGLVRVGDGGARARARRRQADPALGGLLGLPLVPRDGARELRGPRGGGSDEPPLRQHQGGPRGAARPRPDLPDRAPDAGAARRRLAAHHVPLARRHAVLGRHVFSEDLALRAARVRRDPRAHRARCGASSVRRSASRASR